MRERQNSLAKKERILDASAKRANLDAYAMRIIGAMTLGDIYIIGERKQGEMDEEERGVRMRLSRFARRYVEFESVNGCYRKCYSYYDLWSGAVRWRGTKRRG